MFFTMFAATMASVSAAYFYVNIYQLSASAEVDVRPNPSTLRFTGTYTSKDIRGNTNEKNIEETVYGSVFHNNSWYAPEHYASYTIDISSHVNGSFYKNVKKTY